MNKKTATISWLVRITMKLYVRGLISEKWSCRIVEQLNSWETCTMDKQVWYLAFWAFLALL